ncbi:hypothetical protein [Xenorhabdus thuongxuanensis]|uniref:Inverse autotransporter beta-barrel domain-containing protein n=1 Tax=Xenorhabdus thuongxuanensis TaxID=1873484 RepID=A0A1Q5U3L6_9GAMM|nr:hypothetical protein [Xenorhabdus thuongxuanensis]OKP07071.1 hypothetical protein Xentx_01673 [Xenorhabdus thuongxuanensis]
MINNRMEISINTKADLVIYQSVSFTVTLSSDQPILMEKTVTIKNTSKNIRLDQKNPIPLIYTDGNKKASAQLSFTVEDPSGASIQDGSNIIFEIHTDATTSEGDFNIVKFAGKANEIDLNSLALFVEQPFLQMPLDGEKPKYTSIYTILKNKNTQKVLVGTPIFITSQQHNKMDEFSFKDETNTVPLFLEKVGHTEGLTITSNKNGLVKFYLYPKTTLVSVVSLWSYILSDVVNIRSEANKLIYIINYSEPTFLNSIGTPDILGYSPSGIYANSGLSYFMISISSYDQASPGDMILFFVKDLDTKTTNFTGYSAVIEDPKSQLDKYSITLPYSIFKQQAKPYEFSYIVVKKGGDALYSETLPVTYLGGVPYEPEASVNRNYKPCIVHTSLGVGPDNIIPSGYGNYVNIDAIIKYPGYTHNGLFVEIVRSNTHDPNEEIIPVPSNITDITLNMYINSQNKNFIKSYTQQVTLHEIGSNGNANSIFFHIPYTQIVNIRGVGDITFDYQFYQEEEIKYGVSWSANIETIPDPGSIDNTDE